MQATIKSVEVMPNGEIASFVAEYQDGSKQFSSPVPDPGHGMIAAEIDGELVFCPGGAELPARAKIVKAGDLIDRSIDIEA